MDVEPVPGHEKHCFIVMPFGRTDEDIEWYSGWYSAVIEPAVLEAGYVPKISRTEEKPSAINDEIREHLVFDPMVVCDLGGRVPEDPPNPNVMYELGIRHAFGFPHVVMAWKGQPLPFDVGNQRAIMEARRLIDIEPTKRRLKTFIESAVRGDFYRPMEAVGLTAALKNPDIKGQDDLLLKMHDQMRNLHDSLAGQLQQQERRLHEMDARLREALAKLAQSQIGSGPFTHSAGGFLGGGLLGGASGFAVPTDLEFVTLPDGSTIVRRKESGGTKPPGTP